MFVIIVQQVQAMSQQSHYLSDNCIDFISDIAFPACILVDKRRYHLVMSNAKTYALILRQAIERRKASDFVRWLREVQGKTPDGTKYEVPREVFDTVRILLCTRSLPPVIENVRRILKECRLEKYYEYSHVISRDLGGYFPPALPSELEDRLTRSFSLAVRAFINHCTCSGTNKSFLPHSYITRKLLTIFREHKLLELFPELKSADKKKKNDLLWEPIREENGWPC